MAYQLFQICDRCKVKIDTDKYVQNYEQCHEVTISVKNSYTPNRVAFKLDLCCNCEELLFSNFLKNLLTGSTRLNIDNKP